MKKGDIVSDLPITTDDFKRNSDIVPVSDPHIFSETQRMAQNQAVLQLMQQYPQAFDQAAVLQRVLKQMKVPAVNELMPNIPKAIEQDSANENAAMALGKPAFAYPRQDQLAHIQSHLNFALDPNLGSNNLIAPKFIPLALEHIKQHMMLWYTHQMQGYLTAGTKLNIGKYEDSKLAQEIDKAMAVASTHVKMDTQQVFSGVNQALQQLGQVMQQFAPQPQVDPADQAILQASLAETQRRAAKDQADTAYNNAKLQADMAEANKRLEADIAMNAENNLTDERMKSADLTVDELKLQKEQQQTALKLQHETQQHLGG